VLCKESPPNADQKAVPEGTVFVRRPGETTRASKQEMDKLQERLLDRSDTAPAVEVRSLTYRGEALAWYRPEFLPAEIDRWVSACDAAERRAAERTDRRLYPERYPTSPGLGSTPTSAAGLQSSLSRLTEASAVLGSERLMSQPDERSLDEYLEELDDWAERLREAAAESFESRFIHACDAFIRFEVNNRSDRNLENVQVRVRFDWPGLRGFHEWDQWCELPPPPREFGERRSLLSAFGSGLQLPVLDGLHVDPLPRSSWIEEGSVVAVSDLGHVYPHDFGASDAFAFVLTERPPEGMLTGQWEVRASNVDAVSRGKLHITVKDAAAEPVEILEHEPSEG